MNTLIDALASLGWLEESNTPAPTVRAWTSPIGDAVVFADAEKREQRLQPRLPRFCLGGEHTMYTDDPETVVEWAAAASQQPD